MATDPDSSPEQLLFHVSDSSNGYVAFTHAPSNSIATFTQLDVNNGRVVFVRYPSIIHITIITIHLSNILNCRRHEWRILVYCG